MADESISLKHGEKCANAICDRLNIHDATVRRSLKTDIAGAICDALCEWVDGTRKLQEAAK